MKVKLTNLQWIELLKDMAKLEVINNTDKHHEFLIQLVFKPEIMRHPSITDDLWCLSSDRAIYEWAIGD
jgi:hypothetical protein